MDLFSLPTGGALMYKKVVTTFGLGTPDNQVLINFDGKDREPLGLAADELLLLIG
jgi:hypothetical protein